MNALLGLLAWLLGIFSPSHASADQMPGRDVAVVPVENSNGIHGMNHNPRTVVALEDTHFSPAK